MALTLIASRLLLLAAVLICIGLITFAGTVWAMAVVLLKPERMSDAKAMVYLNRTTPSDLGLDYESVSFTVSEFHTGKILRMTGWWVPAPPDSPPGRLVVVLHGYTDAKVGALAWAPLFRSFGFNVLAVDLRAHGASQGKHTTAGFFERDDISQVISQARDRWPSQSRFLALFGASLGAAVAVAAGVQRDDIDAMMLDSPYYDFSHALLAHGRELGIPGRTFQKAALWVSQKLARIDYSKVRPIDLIPKIRCPLWVAQATDDPFVPPEDQRAVAQAVQLQGGDVWQIDQAYHVMGMNAEPTEYRRRLEKFLSPLLHAESPRAAASSHPLSTGGSQ